MKQTIFSPKIQPKEFYFSSSPLPYCNTPLSAAQRAVQHRQDVLWVHQSWGVSVLLLSHGGRESRKGILTPHLLVERKQLARGPVSLPHRLDVHVVPQHLAGHLRNGDIGRRRSICAAPRSLSSATPVSVPRGLRLSAASAAHGHVLISNYCFSWARTF